MTNYSTKPQTIYSSTFSTYGTLHVLKGCGEAYANADYWKNFTIVEDAVDPNPTGIRNVTLKEGESKKYDLSGKPIYGKAKGLVIVNGKKIVEE